MSDIEPTLAWLMPGGGRLVRLNKREHRASWTTKMLDSRLAGALFALNAGIGVSHVSSEQHDWSRKQHDCGRIFGIPRKGKDRTSFKVRFGSSLGVQNLWNFLAATLSHLEVRKRALASGDKLSLILEDDCVLASSVSVTCCVLKEAMRAMTTG